MDNLQLLLGIIFQRDRIAYRFTLIVHHVLVFLCSSGIFLLDPYIHIHYARISLIEVTTIFLHLRNFGKRMNSDFLYFVGGFGTLFIYPFLRIVIPIVTVYTWGFSDRLILRVFVSDNGINIVIVFITFVFFMSMYYTVFVLWSKPSSIYKLKRKVSG